jgi:hypothetical protein
MHNEATGSGDTSSATLIKSADFNEKIGMEGHYVAKCYDKDGNLKWEDIIENQVVQVGKILMLDTLFSGSAYTTVGPFMGLVNATPTFSPTDTFSSHVGWTENTSYTYSGSGVRATVSFSGATGNNNTTPGSNVATKQTSAAVAFTFTGSGTIAGCFIVTGTGATNAFSNTTTGTLYSAGSFTGGSKTVASTDQLNVTYSTTATS